MSRLDSPLKGRVIFVVGARRSGTNWIQRILTARSDVAGMPTETYLFAHGISALEARVQHGTPGLPRTGVAYMSRDAFLDASRDFVDRVLEEHLRTLDVPATHVVERTPWHVYNVGLMAAVYPEAPIVHVVRDGRDVTRSLLSQEWGPDSMEVAAEEWRSSVGGARKAGANLANYIEVSYERLLTHPEQGIPALYERVGLDLPPDVLEEVALEARSSYNVDPSFPQIGSGKWRTALSPHDLRTFDRIAGPLLQDLGYRRESPPAAESGERLKAGARAFRSRLGAARHPRAAADAALAGMQTRRISAALEQNAAVVERLYGGFVEGRYYVLDEVVTPSTAIRVVDAGEAWSGRGPSATDRLRAALIDHQERGLNTVAADSMPSVDMYTVVDRYVLDDGSTWSRTLVVTFGGERVIEIAVFRHPVAAEA